MARMVEPLGSARRRVALDVMGGDLAPAAQVAGAIEAARVHGYEIQLIGPEAIVRAELARQPHAGLDELLPVVDAPEVIGMHEHPAAAVRRKRKSSMAVGIDRVKSGEADCFVSAGNSGAVLATALLGLRRIEGITSERPALAAPFPTVDPNHTVVILDVGANVDCKPEWLAQFAVMGMVFAEASFGRVNPRVGLLSIGEEEGKGNALVAQAAPLIMAIPGIHYIGNVEGKDIPAGLADVIVSDGFAGNVYIKGAEGIVAAMLDILRAELQASPVRKLAAAVLRPAFRTVRDRLNYEVFGGVPLLGVNGVCIVAHGRSTPRAMTNAISAGVRCVDQQLVERIRERLAAGNR